MSLFDDINRSQVKNLVVAGTAWVLDGFDVMVYAFVLVAISSEWGLPTSVLGGVATVSLIGSAIGGILCGAFADYFGRTKALMLSVLLFSVFSGFSGLAQNVFQLGVARFLLGLGMGGAYVSGALLIAETWPDQHRGKGLSIYTSGWAVGSILAALLSAALIPKYGWRVLFFLGALPGIAVLRLLRKHATEPTIWLRRSQGSNQARGGLVSALSTLPLWKIWSGEVGKRLILATTMLSFIQFAYWGLFIWLPGFLALPESKGGANLGIVIAGGWFVAVQVGALVGTSMFGVFSDRIGRKPAFIGYLVVAALLVPVYGMWVRQPILLLVMAPLIGFFGQGYFAMPGCYLPELFPTEVRGTASGFAQNTGRAMGAIAPYIIGLSAAHYGIGVSLSLTSAFFLLGGLTILLLPETKGGSLDKVGELRPGDRVLLNARVRAAVNDRLRES